MTGATVFYTIVDELNSFNELKTANWREGDNTSYKNTKELADVGYGIMLVARIEKKWGTIGVQYAKTKRTGWRPVNGWHFVLLEFFQKKMNEAPEGKCLSVFFNKIEEEKAIAALKELIASECGINGDSDSVERAIHKINCDLEALGLITGDWTFYPMLKTLGAKE